MQALEKNQDKIQIKKIRVYIAIGFPSKKSAIKKSSIVQLKKAMPYTIN